MTPYFVLYRKIKDCPNDITKAHCVYIQSLTDSGYLLSAGAIESERQMTLLIKAIDKTHCNGLLENDPLIKNSIYRIEKHVVWKPTLTDHEEISIKNPPQSVTLLYRKLKPSQSYDDFYAAWLPAKVKTNPRKTPAAYYPMPVRVINATNCDNPQDVISIGLVWEKAENLLEQADKYTKQDSARAQNIAEVAKKKEHAVIYQIQNINELGPIAAPPHIKATLRKIANKDIKSCIKLFYQTVHHVNNDDYTPSQCEAWAPSTITSNPRWQSLTQNHGVLIEYENELLGFADMDDSGYIDRLFVHKDWQRCAIATKLLTRLEAIANKYLLPKLHVQASITAKGFFERHGFIVKKGQRVEINGQYLDNFIMEKPLV
jgi:putative acetyltransferase